MKCHFILSFYGLEILQPDMTSDDTVPLSRWYLTHNMIPLTSTAKKKPKFLAYTTSNNTFPALTLSHECGLTHKEFESGISGFRREVADSYVFLRCYTASNDNFLPKFRDKLSVPNSWFKNLDPCGLDR